MTEMITVDTATASATLASMLSQGQAVHALIVTAPVLVVGPCPGRPGDLHLTSLCARPLPAK